ncbi:MAG: rhomboid family intramembrane serine protease [Bacteroidetes bacterium]|nr:MAG: rhomboid family intramembrane serine protease [Bacteroidota bacterium]
MQKSCIFANMLLLIQLGGLEITMNALIIIVTCIVSYLAENDHYLKERYLFYPYQIKRRNEGYRFITGGFLHSGYMHLAFNMFTLYSFGRLAELMFQVILEHKHLGSLVYLLFYLSAIAVSSIVSYQKHQDNVGYRALGASGAVSAVVFAIILLMPLGNLRIFFVPMPAFIFGGLYLFYSYYMSQNSNDNIGHDAHFFGALYGLLFMFAMRPQALWDFFDQLSRWNTLLF